MYKTLKSHDRNKLKITEFILLLGHRFQKNSPVAGKFMIKFSTGSLGLVFRKFFKKLNATYQVTVTNDETLQEAMVIHLTKSSVYLFLSAFLVALFLVFSGLIFFTPIRYYIPGYNRDISREKLKSLQVLGDSIGKLNALREQYVLNLMQVAQGHVQFSQDTQMLTDQEIRSAQIENDNRVDRASRYDYLKNQKPDTLKNTQGVDKDTLKR